MVNALDSGFECWPRSLFLGKTIFFRKTFLNSGGVPHLQVNATTRAYCLGIWVGTGVGVAILLVASVWLECNSTISSAKMSSEIQCTRMSRMSGLKRPAL